MPRFKKLVDLPDQIYHGTVSIYTEFIRHSIRLSRCSEFTDFGRGFYTTTNYKQALDWAIKKTELYIMTEISDKPELRECMICRIKPAILVYNLDVNALRSLMGVFLCTNDDKWADFVYNNRTKNFSPKAVFYNQRGKYDFAYGDVADASVGWMVKMVRKGIMSPTDFKERLTAINPEEFDQLSFHTGSAIKCVKLIKEVLIDEYVFQRPAGAI